MTWRVPVYLTIFVIALGCALLWWYASHLSVVEPTLAPSYDVHAKLVDLYLDSVKSLSSYALLVIAGVGYFIQLIIQEKTEVKLNVRRLGRYLLVLTVFACAVSLLFGFLGYMNIVDMFHGGLELNPSDPRVLTFHQIQFWSFMVSLVVFGIFSCETLLG